MLDRAEIATTVIRPDLGQPILTIPDAIDGVVVMGGPMGVYESDTYPHLRDEMRLLERALARRIPTLGICLGSQLLAAVLGAPVRKAPHKEIGWLPVMWDIAASHDPLFHEVSWQPLTVLHWHGDAYPLPSGTVALAHSAETECQAFRYEEQAYGVLFHMETDAAQIERMASTFADELESAHVDREALVRDAHRYAASTGVAARRVFGAWTKQIHTHITE
jgi:GMP synthase (glutamine-hydrolysing)